LSDFNQQVIDEFHANNGKVGGYFEGQNMILLHTIGAKSGVIRTTPLVYTTDGEKLVIIASKGGAPEHPDWYRNLIAHPEVDVEVGSETFKVKATEAHGAERDRLYAGQVAVMPGFADYEVKTKGIRTIPVLVLERIAN
jgi:deazaflavin-dependent oxidoreductase (nitroreductase family)